MKKLICILLCAVMLTGVVAVQTVSVSAEGSRNMMAEYVLSNLGIITANTDMGSDLGQSITRARFAEMLAQILGVSETDAIYFDDVPTDHWAFGSVNALVDMGIVSRAADRKFNPDDFITYEQAYKMMLCAAGYGEYAEVTGGYPLGYSKLVGRFDLNENVSGNSGFVSYDDGISILWNGVTIPTYTVERFGADGAITYRVDDETLLGMYRDLYVGESVLTDYNGGTINGIEAEKNEVYMDGVRYLVDSAVNPEPFFARATEFLYEKKNETDDAKIVFIEADTKNNDVAEITSDSITAFNSGSYSIEYYKDASAGKISSIPINRGATVIYNGLPYTGEITKIFDKFADGTHRGTVAVVEYPDREDVVLIESYRPFVVSLVDSLGNIYNQYNRVDKVETDRAKAVKICDVMGVPSTHSIVAGDALMVGESMDKSIIRIMVAGFSVSGIVDTVSENGTKIVIDGKEYKADHTFAENGGKLEAGEAYSVAVDPYGYIIACKKTDGTALLKAGWIVKGTSVDGVFVKDMLFKIFDESGKMGEYGFADRVIFDGSSYEKTEITERIISGMAMPEVDNGKVGAQLIRFGLDSEGKIREVDSVVVGENENPDYTLTKHISAFERLGANNPNKLSRYISMNVGSGYERLINSDMPFSTTYTKMIKVPHTNADGNLQIRLLNGLNVSNNSTSFTTTGSDTGYVELKDASGNSVEATDGMYAVISSMLTGANYMEVYKWNAESVYAECVVVHEDGAVADKSWYMVKGISEAIDDSGEEVAMLETHAGSYRAECDLSDISEGDIVIIDKNSSTGNIMRVTKAYDASEDKMVNQSHPSYKSDYWWRASIDYPYGYVEYFQLTMGTAVDLKSGILFVDWEGDKDAFGNDDSKYDEAIYASKIPVTVYDKKDPRGEKVYSGSVADIITSMSAGEGSRVLHGFYSTNESGVFIIKK